VTVDLVVRARRAVLGDGEAACSVVVEDGRIRAVARHDADVPARRTVVLGDDEVLLPGLVDTHVHVNEPGRTEWEGFAHATRAAAAGGVTTLLDMPLNSIPPTTTVDALATKRAAAAGQVHVEVGFWGGAVPGNLADLAPLHDAGVFGFKCFLAPSGVEEFPHLAPEELRRTMGRTAALGALLLVHAEDAHVLEAAPAPVGRAYSSFLASRPRQAEHAAITLVVDALRSTGGRAHVLHLADGWALPAVRAARADGLDLSVETCPHYLVFCSADVPDGATEFKCCPPIRDDEDRERLWDGLRSGDVQLVVSDHSPCTPDLKCLDTGDFGEAWGGIASLQVGLPAVWTAARARGLGLAQVVRWMATAPADRVGLASKGRIAPGADADFCVLAPEEAVVVDPAALHSRNPVTPYAGRRLLGQVRSTWLRGRQVDLSAEPSGRLLLRGQR
jgi:allantoinase